MSQITVIHILRKAGIDYQKIIHNNANFLHTLNVDYLIYDNLESFEVLKIIKNIENLSYVRKVFTNLKQTFLESGLLANGEKVIYLKSDDILNMQNVEILEKERPNILKKDLLKINNIKNLNFKYSEFNLLIKENKTFWEKLKLLF